MTQFTPRSLSEDSRKSSYFLDEAFVCNMQSFSDNLHVFTAYDFSHHLDCKITLEIREAWGEDKRFSPVASCTFSDINLEEFAQATGLSDYHQRTVVFLFQLKILKELFLFCEAQDVTKIVITASDASLDYLEIFSPFFASQNRITTDLEAQTQVTIPADEATYHDILDFAHRLEQDFRKVLWQEHRLNPMVRDYLKQYSCV